MYNWDCKTVSYIMDQVVAGCLLFRGCLSIEVNGRTVGTFRIVCYIAGVSIAVEGCPLSGVPLYQFSSILVIIGR